MRLALLAPVLACAAALLLAGCGAAVRSTTSERISLAYLGHVELGKPSSASGELRIPLKLTGGRWNENSGRVLEGIDAERRGREIHFRAATCVSTSGPAVDPVIVVETPPPGVYRILYDDPDGTSSLVGEIELE